MPRQGIRMFRTFVPFQDDPKVNEALPNSVNRMYYNTSHTGEILHVESGKKIKFKQCIVMEYNWQAEDDFNGVKIFEDDIVMRVPWSPTFNKLDKTQYKIVCQQEQGWNIRRNVKGNAVWRVLGNPYEHQQLYERYKKIKSGIMYQKPIDASLNIKHPKICL